MPSILQKCCSEEHAPGDVAGSHGATHIVGPPGIQILVCSMPWETSSLSKLSALSSTRKHTAVAGSAQDAGSGVTGPGIPTLTTQRTSRGSSCLPSSGKD